MKKLNLVGLNKRNDLTNEQLGTIKGGYMAPGNCNCGCICTFANPASGHDSSNVSRSDVKGSVNIRMR